MGSKVRYGEAKDESCMGGKEGEGGAYFSALCLGRKKQNKTKTILVFRKYLFNPHIQIHQIMVRFLHVNNVNNEKNVIPVPPAQVRVLKSVWDSD